MFGKKGRKNKISKPVDKLVKGIIIGGAIGSVVGATLKPQKSGLSKKKKKKSFVTSFTNGLKILFTGKK